MAKIDHPKRDQVYYEVRRAYGCIDAPLLFTKKKEAVKAAKKLAKGKGRTERYIVRRIRNSNVLGFDVFDSVLALVASERKAWVKNER